MDQFEQSVWDARGLLKSIAMKSVGNSDDADDLVSQAMLNALSYRKRFDGTNVNAWLTTILKNLIRDRFNKGYRKQRGTTNRVQRLVYTDDPAYADNMVAPDNPERSMIVMEAWGELRNLPDDQAEAVVLAGIGCTYEEMKREIGVPIGTVKSRVHRGRQMLAASGAL